MNRHVRAAAVAALISFVLAVSSMPWGATVAAAQDRRQNEPGAFDFYVLSLSWSPSYCEASAERSAQRAGRRGAEQSPEQGTTRSATTSAEASSPSSAPSAPSAQASGEASAASAASAPPSPAARRRRPDPQCGPRAFSFVVHGLWPQYERGFPEYCQTPAPRLERDLVASMLDLMPSPRLIIHQWNRHGVCSGLSANGYFEAVRKARAVIKIPPEYLDLRSALTVTPAEVEDAFVKANPGLSPDGIAVRCQKNRVREVRICLSRAYKFQDCPDVNRRACRREQLTMPPVRGG